MTQIDKKQADGMSALIFSKIFARCVGKIFNSKSIFMVNYNPSSELMTRPLKTKLLS